MSIFFLILLSNIIATQYRYTILSVIFHYKRVYQSFLVMNSQSLHEI